jgi:hypothetical protein
MKAARSSDSNGQANADGARVGRNDPCPCGSGKKHKKCCWDKDRQRRELPAPAPAKEDLRPPSDGDDVAVGPGKQRGWRAPQFDRAGYEKRIADFQHAMDSSDISGDAAFEFRVEVHKDCVGQGESARYPTLVLACDNLREYLFDRGDGQHDPPRRAPGGREWSPVGRGFLVPDEPSMDHWGGGLMGFPFPQPSRFAAVLLVLPAWLRFLAARGLATAAEAETALESLRSLAETGAQVLAGNEVTSAVIADLRRRWQLPTASR